VNRFSSMKKAEEYMAKSTGPGDPFFDDPTAFQFPEGSALPNGPAGWEIHITFLGSSETQALWGPVITSAARPSWIGAMRPTSTTGELSAIYQALAWIRSSSLPPAPSNPWPTSVHIARINVLLDQVKRDSDISISWTPAHTAADTRQRGQARRQRPDGSSRGDLYPRALLSHLILPS